MEKKKWYHFVLYIILGIVLLPVILLFLIYSDIKNKIESRRRKKTIQQAHRQEQSISISQSDAESPAPPSDAEFIAHFDAFIGVQFYSHNGLSGRSHKRALVVSEHPEQKERILSFVERYPICDLLQGERNSEGCDLNHWQITFLFEDSRLNRRIFGYGITECTRPYLQEMIFYLPEVLSKEEALKRKAERERLMN